MTRATPPPVDETPRVAPRKPGDPLQTYLLYRRHLFAYESAAARMSQGGSCLDIGAGLGYGLSLLADRAADVTALDLSDVALQKLPALPNLKKVQGDATELPFSDGSFDAVVAFQVIEHVPRKDAVRALSEMRRVLRPGGKAFVTTPNARWRLLPGQRPWNPHHVHEYTSRDLARLIEEAGLSSAQLSGVIGRNGAQEIERARVAPSMLRTYGWLPGRLLSRVIRRFAPGNEDNARRPTTGDDLALDWFELTDKRADGLDFFVEFER